jgi:hypothetical protein
VGKLPIHFVQIVNQVAAAKDQDAALAHFPSLAPERQMPGKGARLLEAHLKHRNIGLRIQLAQDAPPAVIRSPLLIPGQDGVRKPGAWPVRERRERDFVKRLGERVVNRGRPLRGEDLTAGTTQSAETTQIAWGRGNAGPSFSATQVNSTRWRSSAGRRAVGQGYEFEDSRKNLAYKGQCNFPWGAPL